MRHIYAAGSIALLASCNFNGDSAARRTPRLPEARASETVDSASLQWRFTPTQAEAESILVLLGRVAERGGGPLGGRGIVPASVHLFDRDSSGRSFVLLAYQTPIMSANGDTIWGPSFYLIERRADTFELSAPWPLRDAEGSTLEFVGDVNADGATDLAYCERYEGGDPPAASRAITASKGTWSLLVWQPGNPAVYCEP